MRAKNKDKLSKEPKQIRNRLRRKHDHFAEDLDMYLEAIGKPMHKWDMEELARGRIRDRNGGFQGRTPAWITPAVQREAKRRLMDHAFGKLAGHIDQAIIVLGNLLTSTELDDFGRPIVDARTKLAAATFILEHVLGKPKAVVEVESADLVRQFLAGALVLGDGKPAHPVIDGQFTEEEEDDSDDAE